MSPMLRTVLRRHRRRFLLQLAILISMVIVDLVSDDVFVAIVAISIIILPTATWTVFTLLLWSSSKAPDIESLAERVDDALSAALSSTVAAVIGAIVFLRIAGIVNVPIGSFLSIGLAFIIVTTSVPALSFLKTWRDVYLPMVRRRAKEREEEAA